MSIFRMAERLSGRWPDCQGFCGVRDFDDPQVRGVARSRYSSINLTCRIPSSHLRLYRLSTAKILYWMPDHPSVLQSFVWQQYDKPPEFPVLHRFLGFWKDNIDATLHSRQWAEMPGIPQPMRF